MGLTIAHQELEQLSQRILGAISNVCTKVIFGIGRYDAEYLGKIVGRVDTEAIKRPPKNETQYELFSTLIEQWEGWIHGLRFQPARQMSVSLRDGSVIKLRAINVPW